MTALRRHIALHRSWAVWLIVLALALRMLVPSGYMPDVGGGGTLTIRLCEGAGPVPMPMVMPGMAHAMAGQHGHASHDHHQHDGNAQPCAFASATIAGLDTIAAIALAPPILPRATPPRVALPRAPPFTSARDLRPPSQAPPPRQG